MFIAHKSHLLLKSATRSKCVKFFLCLCSLNLLNACADVQQYTDQISQAIGIEENNDHKNIEELIAADAEKQKAAETALYKEIQQFLSKQPPNYSVGDYYILNNPDTIWTVNDISDGLVTWISDTGAIQRTYSNPVLPALEWESISKGRGRRFISHREGQMFPLKERNKFSFLSSVDSDQFPYQWQLRWQCSIDDMIHDLESSVGIVDAWKIVCGRDGRKEITYYYAPRVGYYVAVEIVGSGEKAVQRRHLVDYGNKAIAQVELNYNLVPNSERDFVQNKFNPRDFPNDNVQVTIQFSDQKENIIDEGVFANNRPLPKTEQTNANSSPQPQRSNQTQITNQQIVPVLTLPPPILPEYDEVVAQDLRPAYRSDNSEKASDVVARQSHSIIDRRTADGTPVIDNQSLSGTSVINDDHTGEGEHPADRDSALFPWNQLPNADTTQVQQSSGIVPDARANLPWQQNQPLANGQAVRTPGNDERLPAWVGFSVHNKPLLHLASYANTNEADAGWVVLQQNNPSVLVDMTPVTVEGELNGKKFVRLYAYGSRDFEDANARCNRLNTQGTHCDIVSSQQR
ncbi:MAG: hypothetical protein AAF403_02765 [Pseudomonadota bacterium]